MFLLLLLSAIKAYAGDTTYFDVYHRPCDQQHATYFQPAPIQDSGLYRYSTFSMNGRIKETGFYSTLDSGGKKEGKYKSYDSLGFVQSEGMYHNNKQDGKWKFYYEGSDLLWYRRYFQDGKKTGKLESFYKTGPLKRVETYVNDTLVSGQCFTEEGGEMTYTPFEKMPEQPFGPSGVNGYLVRSMRYPEEAEEKKQQGRVIVRFVVSEDGSVTDVEVIQSVSRSCDAEAVRVVRAMPKWRPGIQDDKPVKVWYTLPLSFRLN